MENKMINITFPDNSIKSFEEIPSGIDIAKSISEGFARNCVAMRIDGRLLDLNLPDMSGYEVLRTLRVSKVKTPILILSGNAGIDFLQLRPIIEQNPDITRDGVVSGTPQYLAPEALAAPTGFSSPGRYAMPRAPSSASSS